MVWKKSVSIPLLIPQELVQSVFPRFVLIDGTTVRHGEGLPQDRPLLECLDLAWSCRLGPEKAIPAVETGHKRDGTKMGNAAGPEVQVKRR